jgi:tRNA-specific 2-thiouridylase
MAKVLCAMSGGVDSSVAAYLLKKAGHDVMGIFLRLGAGSHEGSSSKACCSMEDSRDAALVASRLDIPYYSLNYSGEFERIIDHFVAEYHRGRTPNPCVLCNQWLKFGSLREKARALGCGAIATGHYARIERSESGTPQLLRGRDASKDQSYFLFLMPRESLSETYFPVGGLTKSKIREIARSANLPVAEKPESQEICFVPNDDYREVLRARTPDKLRPGKFIDLSGSVLGEHRGHQNFTVGQRRGVGIALGKPAYVVDIDASTNTVTLADRECLRRTEVDVAQVQWISIDTPRDGVSLRVEAQIRHHHHPRPATVTSVSATQVLLRFDEYEEAVAPGQAAVFYRGDVVLGGGWIEAAR